MYEKNRALVFKMINIYSTKEFRKAILYFLQNRYQISHLLKNTSSERL